MFNLNLKKLYLLAICTMSGSVILSNYLSNQMITSNAQYSKLINLSGKQRMLSQRLIILAKGYYLNQNDKTKLALITRLEEFKTTHKYLLTQILTKQQHTTYFQDSLDSDLKLYISHFYNLLKSNEINYLYLSRDTSKDLLDKLNLIVTEYEKDSVEKIDTLLTDEFYLMIVTLFVLFLQTIFIFRPVILKINKAQDDLQNRQEYEETVIESSNNAIIAIDWTSKITTYNKKAQEIFGWTKEEMIGTRNLLNIIPEKYKKAHIKSSTRFLTTGKSSGVQGKAIELEGIRNDGTIFPLRITFGSKYKPNGAIVVANITDISLEKQQNIALEQQSKMASMGEMISNIAHQWRQPLSLISSLSTGAMAKKEYDMLSDEDFNDTMVQIDESVQFLSNTIDDFRNFYKVSHNKEKFQIIKSISTIETIIKESYKISNISISKEYTNTDISCYGIQSQLSQVFLNFFNNSKDILIEKELKNKLVHIELKEDNDTITIKFFDNAGGIPVDIIDKVFDPYFTTKQDAKGTGIGLHMSSEIINKHFNGKLSVSNESFDIKEEKYYGACFTVTIPSKS